MLTGKTWRGQEPWLPRHDIDPPRAIEQVIASVSRSLCDTGLLYEKTRLQLVYLPPGGQGCSALRRGLGQDRALQRTGSMGRLFHIYEGVHFCLFLFFPLSLSFFLFFLTPPCSFARDIFGFACMSVCGVGVYAHLHTFTSVCTCGSQRLTLPSSLIVLQLKKKKKTFVCT